MTESTAPHLPAAAGPGPGEPSLLLGLLGEHIAGSLTPLMHESEARRQGLLMSYRSLDGIDLGPLAQRISSAVTGTPEVDGPEATGTDWAQLVELAQLMTFDGLNVTHPAKQAVQPSLDEVDEDAQLLGAVNTVVFRDGRTIGMNTDHRGFADALGSIGGGSGADLERVVQLGAGGAGAATAYALLRAGAEHLTIVDVDRSRSEALIARLAEAFDASQLSAATPDEAPTLVARASGLVNSTPIGMTGVSDASPVDVSALHSGLWVGDAVYRPVRTTLVRAAQALGCEAFGGTQMVVGQAAAAFEIFTGRAADRAYMERVFLAHAPE